MNEPEDEHTLLPHVSETKTIPMARWKVLLCWQLLSIVLTGSGAFSQLLAERGLNAPCAQSLPTYMMLALIHIWFLEKLKFPWWKYALLGFCDVEGNFLIVTAYQFTTITSVQLLDCFSIVIVMVGSYLVFHIKPTSMQLISCGMCVLGLGLLVLSDIEEQNQETGSTRNIWLGDILVLLSCVLYGTSNIGQEHVIKTYDRVEYLAMIGLSGSIISMIQVSILEIDSLSQVNWSDIHIWLYLGGFNLCLLSFYLFVPLLLKHSSAVLMNLSFLTSDFWSVVVAVYIFQASLSLLYFVSFIIIVIGLMTYHNVWEEIPLCKKPGSPVVQ